MLVFVLDVGEVGAGSDPVCKLTLLKGMLNLIK